jgi:hypothetical protein
MRRVWVWSAILIGGALIAIAVIVTNFPASTGGNEMVPVADAQAQNDVPAAAPRPEVNAPANNAAAAAPPLLAVPDGIPPPIVPPASVPAASAGRLAVGIGAPIPGGTLPEPFVPSAELQGAIAAYVDALTAALPRIDGNVALDSVSVVGNQLHFVNTIQIDLADYVYAYDPAFLGPRLLGWSCDGSMCFEFDDDYAREPCRSDVADLIARGAVAIYVYRDTRGRFMGQMAVTDAECDRLAGE